MDTNFPAKPQDAPGGEAADAQEASREALEAGHETTDVSLKGLTIFGGGSLVFLLLVLGAVAFFYKGFDLLNGRLDQRRARTEPGTASLVQMRPSYDGPLLQVKPEEDLRWMRRQNTTSLTGYGWIDRKSGVVQMPIDRAMELLAERGLPPISPGKTLEELQRERAQPQVAGEALRP